MPINLELQQICQEADGTYTVSVNAVDSVSGAVIIKGKTFQAQTAAELKNKIKPKFEALIASEQIKNNLRSVAQTVLDEIMSEVSQ